MKPIITALIAAAVISGCAELPTISAASHDVQREFTYDYIVPGKNKSELWKNARDFFAEAFGDSRSVIRLADEADGTIIGKATAPWAAFSATCTTDYHVRFAAKDGKARLQLELIEGVGVGSQCGGWSWPTIDGYKTVTASFESTSKRVSEALNGEAKSSTFKNF